VRTQPEEGEQESIVQGLLSLQFSGMYTHSPVVGEQEPVTH